MIKDKIGKGTNTINKSVNLAYFMNKKGKKIAFWGTGIICKECLKWHPDVKPDILIDINSEKKEFNNIQIVHPDNWNGWSEYYIIVTMRSYEKTCEFLQQKGLKPHIDFETFVDFFSSRINCENSIKKIANWTQVHKDYKDRTLVFAPMFTCRQSSNMIHFFKNYNNARKPAQCIFLSQLGVVSEEEVYKRVNIPVFEIPEICDYDVITQNIDLLYIENCKEIDFVFSLEELQWIQELVSRKRFNSTKKALHLTKIVYFYVKSILEILQPKNIILWGGWSSLNYIIAKIATDAKIPYGFMEYGWIPGTYQFDRGGISGQSEYAQNPQLLLNIPIDRSDEKIEKIIECVLQNKLDTGIFQYSRNDEEQLKKLNRMKKTIFFVGMGEEGMNLNPQNSFWNKFVSEVFDSTIEATEYLYNICKKNKWNFIFKPHPRENQVEKYMEWKGLHDFIFITDMEIDQIIKLSDVVISIQSAVEYKALMYNKPLVEVGHGAIQGQQCSYYVKDKESTEPTIKRAIEQGFTKKQKDNFINHLKRLLQTHLWDDLTERELRYGLDVSIDFFGDSKL